MKSFILGLAALTALSSFAQEGTETTSETQREHIQNFYLVENNNWFLEGGFTNVDGEIEYETDTERVEDAYTTLLGQYGFNKQLNVGAELNVFEEKEERDGLGNWELYARGRLEIYLYELRYFFAPEDASEDNAYNDNYFSAKAGLFKNGWGFLAKWQSEYSAYVAAGESASVGSETTLEAFYEYLSQQGNTWAASVGTWHLDRGDLMEDDLTYSFIRGYAAYSFGGIDILPEVQYFNQFNDSDVVESASRTQWQLRLRKTF